MVSDWEMILHTAALLASSAIQASLWMLIVPPRSSAQRIVPGMEPSQCVEVLISFQAKCSILWSFLTINCCTC